MKMTEKNKLMAPMIRTDQSHLFEIAPLRKKFRRRGIIKRKGLDSSLKAPDLLYR